MCFSFLPDKKEIIAKRIIIPSKFSQKNKILVGNSSIKGNITL